MNALLAHHMEKTGLSGLWLPQYEGLESDGQITDFTRVGRFARRLPSATKLLRRVIAPAGIDTVGADVGQFFPRQNSSLFTFTLVHLGN
ncbi:MAG: hypothetical protein MK171_13945, partial [Pirellulales bacterium]|nr:hypothetical protein [Pirellulales bacterium]